MDKSTLRILSRIGLLLVIIGFFMPISCNMNGFQMAKTLETFGGSNILSLSLYAIFIFSCLGIIFPLVYYFIKKPYNIKNDWINIIVLIVAFSFFIFSCIKDLKSPIFRLQSGAYIIIMGLLFSLICLIKYSLFSNKVIKKQSNVLKNKYCTECGSKLQENNNFCINCGKKVEHI